MTRQNLAVKLDGNVVGQITLDLPDLTRKLTTKEWTELEDRLSVHAMALPAVKSVVQEQGLSATELQTDAYCLWTRKNVPPFAKEARAQAKPSNVGAVPKGYRDVK